MAAARALDLLLGATATATARGDRRPAASRTGAGHGAVAGRPCRAGPRRPRLRPDPAGHRRTPPAGRSPAPSPPPPRCPAALAARRTHLRRHRRLPPRGAGRLHRRAAWPALADVPPALGAAAPRRRAGAGRAATGARPTAAGRSCCPPSPPPTLAHRRPPLLHAALNPSPPLTQRAVGGGIRAMIPLQAALAARAGRTRLAAALARHGACVPLARDGSPRKVSLT